MTYILTISHWICYLVIPWTVDMHIVAEGAKKYIVNLNTKMYSYGRFQHYYIPCGYVIVVLRYRKLHEAYFCSAFYSLKNFKDAYVIVVEPIPCECTWDIQSYISEPKLMSPSPNWLAGRPKLKRSKGFADVKFKRLKITCSRCRQVGHNRKTVQIILCKKQFTIFTYCYTYFYVAWNVRRKFCFMECIWYH